MPAFIAFITGPVNPVELITVVAIPSAPAEIAEFRKVNICGTLDVAAEPPQLGLGRPSSAAASAKPYWVGTKNGFVVTWLTKVNFHGGVFGKSPIVLAAADPLLLLVGLALLLDEHAASSADAAAVALTSPVPLSSRRRVGPSCMFSVSIASSTFGWTLSITKLRIVTSGQNAAPVVPGWLRRDHSDLAAAGSRPRRCAPPGGSLDPGHRGPARCCRCSWPPDFLSHGYPSGDPPEARASTELSGAPSCPCAQDGRRAPRRRGLLSRPRSQV